MLVLCADSSPFFHPRLAQSVNSMMGKVLVARDISTAVYFGGANGYMPEFTELAACIAEGIGTEDFVNVGHVSSGGETQGSALQLPTLKGPALIMLAGGSVTEGWKILSDATVRAWLEAQLHSGAIFVGVSAGAIHLASGLDDKGEFSQYLGWVPASIAVHEELFGWPASEKLVKNERQVLEIPLGDVVVYTAELPEYSAFQSLKGDAVLNRSEKGRVPISAGCFNEKPLG